MADITMCINNEECKLKDTCYRNTAKPSSIWQSCAPFYKKNTKCKFYIKNKYRN